MIASPTSEFLVIVGIIAVSTVFAVYMAARPQRASVKQDEPDWLDEEEPMADNQQLTFDDALANRDAVLAEVTENNGEWMAEAMRAFELLPETWSGLGEDLRFALAERGVPAPKTPNAWGSLVGTLVKRGALVPTGERRPMKAAGSHGRRSDVYVRGARVAA